MVWPNHQGCFFKEGAYFILFQAMIVPSINPQPKAVVTKDL